MITISRPRVQSVIYQSDQNCEMWIIHCYIAQHSFTFFLESLARPTPILNFSGVPPYHAPISIFWNPLHKSSRILALPPTLIQFFWVPALPMPHPCPAPAQPQF